ncbi:MAG: hypothetical protein Q4G65_08855, partial [bacterium]|nr:hypothetical protein [bacterium]
MGNKRFFGIFAMLLAVLATGFARAGFTRRAIINNSTGADTQLLDGTIYSVAENTTITATAATKSALWIASGATVVIDIPAGITLTVRGGDASGTASAGAGVFLPPSSTLVVVGEGKLVATGGNAASGGNGAKGGDADFNDSNWTTGGGGKGGDGGGGAGAGIGGAGGAGGVGGDGGASRYNDDWYPRYAGHSGSNGTDGANGGSCGTVYALGSLAVEAYAGSSGSGGDGGSSGSNVNDKYSWSSARDIGVGGGGGGGGGAGGRSAARIGGDGAGGGGGGGAGAGGLDYCVKSDYAGAPYGQGGFAAGNGTRGSPDNPGKSVDRSGGTGGSGGSYGSNGGNGTIYCSSASSLPSGVASSLAETHPAISYQLSFSVPPTARLVDGTNAIARLGYRLPNVTARAACEGLTFAGWYTRAGDQYYDANGLPVQTRVYDLCSDLVLYAHWTEAEDPAQELVVNIMEDQQDWVTGDWTVSLREAIEYAAEHPDVVDATGQRRITFDPRVFAPGSSNVVWVTSQIALAGDYFPSDKPLVIEGPTTSQVVLHGSDTHNRFLKLTSGTNRVEVMNLAFYGFRTPNGSQSAEQDGGVFYLKGVNAVVAENCRFEANWADDKGSVAHLDSKGTRFEAERCSFIENRSLYGVVSSSGPDKVIVVRGCTFYANSVYSGIRDLVWSSGSCQLLQNTFVCDPDHLLPRVCPEGGTCQGNLCVRTTPAAGEAEYEADQVLVDGFTPKTAVVDGVLQTFFPIKKGSPADGTGVRIEGRTHDIVGKPIPAADAKVNGISLGSWNQDWEKASTVVTITEDIVDDKDGETSFREAMETSASDACWTNAVGERAVTFASALWDQAGDALVIPCRDRAFPVANPTNAPLVVTGPDTGTKGLVFEGVGSDHVLFEGGEGTGLVLRNLTARGGHGGRGGALDFSADGCHFLVSNCLFTANSATNGIVCGRGDVLNCSFLDNSGCGDVFIHGLLIESTLLGDRPSRIYEEMGAFALGCTVPAGLEVAGNRIYGCITRAEELGGVQLQSYKVGTVTQYAYPIAWGSRFAGKGYFLWHNDAWTALAYSKLIDGRDKVYVCRPAGTVANILHDVDVTGRRISPASGDNRNSAGSYAVPSEPASLVVDSVAVYDDDGEPNFNDGVVTLRDAIFYAHERSELEGSNGPGYRITFDPQLYKDATNGLSLLAPRPYTVDGTNFSSKTPLTIVGDPDARPGPGIDQFQAERLFVVSNSAELVLANLALRGNGLGQAPSFDAQALSPLDAGRRLAPRTIYAVWMDTTIEATAPGQSGLVVEGTDAEPSVIYLYDGAKLTVKGAPAQG